MKHKRFLPILICVILGLTLLFAGCPKASTGSSASSGSSGTASTETTDGAITSSTESEPELPTSGAVKEPSPREQVTGKADFEALGVSIDAPAEGQNITYYILNGEIAEVNFEMGGSMFTYRAGVTTEDVSGIDQRFNSVTTETASKGGKSTEVTLSQSDSGLSLARWMWGDANYSLSATGRVPLDAFKRIVLERAQM